jgi:hypothetical protein
MSRGRPFAASSARESGLSRAIRGRPVTGYGVRDGKAVQIERTRKTAAAIVATQSRT